MNYHFMVKFERALIMDNLVPALEELVNSSDRSVDIEVPNSKVGKELAYDAYEAISFFRPNSSFSFELQVEDKVVCRAYDSDYLFKVVAKGQWPLEQPQESYTSSKLRSPKQTLTVRGSSIPPRIQQKRLQKEPWLYSKLKKELSNRKYAVSLDFKYASLSPFRCDLMFYDQESTRFFKQSTGKTVMNYPISSKKVIEMSNRALQYIIEPVFWSSWSQYHAQSYDVLIGRRTLQDIVSMYNISFSKVKESIAKATEFTVAFMDNKIIPIKYLLQKVRCPQYAAPFFLSKLVNTHNWAFNNKADKLKEVNQKLMLKDPPDLSPLTAAGFTEDEARNIVLEAKLIRDDLK